LLGRAEVLHRADRSDRIEAAERVPGDVPPVHEVRLEPSAKAGLVLARGERDADPVGATLADRAQQRPPAAADVENPGAGADPKAVQDQAVLVALRLVETLPEVTVEERAGEVRVVAERGAEDLVHVVEGLFDLGVRRHRRALLRGSSGTRAAPFVHARRG